MSYVNRFLGLLAPTSGPPPKSRGTSLVVYYVKPSRSAFWEMKFDTYDASCHLEELGNLLKPID